MNTHLPFDFSVNKENKMIHVTREFAATPDLVWDAWTKPEILDRWWAPKPWHAETKSMDFRENGFWLYAMIGPQGERHWSRADYQKIDVNKSFSASNTFCDEKGNVTPGTPRSLWTHVFSRNTNTTTVNIRIQYESPEHLEQMIAMGFKEGFTMGLGNLDEYLKAKRDKLSN